MIYRNISRESRLFEILNSMPKPMIKMEITKEYVPKLKVEAINDGGVCLYKYQTSGNMSILELEQKMKDFLDNNESAQEVI